MKRLRVSVPIAATFLLASCAQGVVIDDPARTATFVLEKGYGNAGLMGGSSNLYFLETGGHCEGLQKIAEMNWSAGKETSRPVPAGGPVTIYGEVVINTDGGYNAVRVNRCAQRATFSSEIGKTYRVRQLGNPGEACTLTVTDEATGAPPPDLTVSTAPICTTW